MEIHVGVWHACSGLLRMGPILAARVYYYPQGHVENYGGSGATQELCEYFPQIKCHVYSMRLLADPATDEVFAHMVMRPMRHGENIAGPSMSKEPEPDFIVSAFLKPLKSCDINGARLSVEKIFDKEKEDSSVLIHDIHNRQWNFQRIFDVASRCHFLTDGWRDFKCSKKLNEGDVLVFMKTKDRRLIVGIRRDVNSISNNKKYTGFSFIGEKDRVSRTANGLCSVNSIGKAMGNALSNAEFEVVYYPMAGKSSFFYDSEAVDQSLGLEWVTGMRVKKNIVVDHRVERHTRHGSIRDIRNDLNSPWKRLKVKWDEIEAEQEENCWEIAQDVSTDRGKKRPITQDLSAVRDQKRPFMLFGARIE